MQDREKMGLWRQRDTKRPGQGKKKQHIILLFELLFRIFVLNLFESFIFVYYETFSVFIDVTYKNHKNLLYDILNIKF